MRTAACGVAITAIVLVAESPDTQRVRATDSVLNEWISSAAVRSPTFAGLLARLAELRGLVYVAWTPTLRRGVQGALLDKFQQTPDGTRCLWVAVRVGQSRKTVMPVVAHELQHAVEVLESGVDSGASLRVYIASRATVPGHSVIETAAARLVERQVARELRSAP